MVWKYVFLSHVLDKNDNIIRDFLKIAKFFFPARKTNLSQSQNQFLKNKKNGLSENTNSRKNLVPHGTFNGERMKDGKF